MKEEGYFGNVLAPVREHLYLIFRVMIGWLFIMHGTSKVFGWWTTRDAMTGFMQYVGIFETLLGLLILLGLWTRLGAFIGIVIMISAWFKAHIPGGWNPFANGGELVLVFLAAFLVIIAYGSGKYGLERWITKEETI